MKRASFEVFEASTAAAAALGRVGQPTATTDRPT